MSGNVPRQEDRGAFFASKFLDKSCLSAVHIVQGFALKPMQRSTGAYTSWWQIYLHKIHSLSCHHRFSEPWKINAQFTIPPLATASTPCLTFCCWDGVGVHQIWKVCQNENCVWFCCWFLLFWRINNLSLFVGYDLGKRHEANGDSCWSLWETFTQTFPEEQGEY